jgi:DNA-binding MurR/RpiR family transcriptional regulator
MLYEERIRQERVNMSKSFAKLADFLLDSYVEAAFMTASELAHVLNLDAATVVRFSQQLGYNGFPELQRGRFCTRGRRQCNARAGFSARAY